MREMIMRCEPAQITDASDILAISTAYRLNEVGVTTFRTAISPVMPEAAGTGAAIPESSATTMLTATSGCSKKTATPGRNRL